MGNLISDYRKDNKSRLSQWLDEENYLPKLQEKHN